MSEKKDRLKEVYVILRKHFDIHTQTDFAVALDMTRPALSSAMNGNEKYLTKNLFTKICASFPKVFNLDYLLTGEGELLLPGWESQIVKDKAANPSYDESAAHDNLIEILSRTIRGVDDLRVQLQQELAEVRALKEELIQLAHRPIVYMQQEQKYVAAAEPNKQ